jgi:hypothetical protein
MPHHSLVGDHDAKRKSVGLGRHSYRLQVFTCFTSELVYALHSITAPFQSSCEVYPYITVFDKEVDIILKTYQKSRDGIVVGGTNPILTKTFEGFPNILRLDKEFEENIIKKNLIMKTIKTSSL